MRNADVHVRQRVTMTAQRWSKRRGYVLRPVWIEAGGCGPREAWLVQLDPTERATGRTVRCYASSFEPTEVGRG